MTNHAHGSSLFQARGSHLHRHSHNKKHINDIHNRSTNNHHIHLHEEVHRRQEPAVDLDSLVTEVVTVSVVQVIDSNGGVIDVKTFFSPPATQPAPEVAGLTVDPAGIVSALPTLPVSGLDTLLPTGSDSTSDLSASQEATPLTSAPSANPSGFLNSTSSVVPLFNNSTLSHSLFTNSSRTVSASSTTLTSSLTSLASETSSSLEETPGATAFAGGDGAPGDSGATGVGVPVPTDASNGSGPTSGPPTSTVVGSVLGGLAGMAVILVVALYLLRWKKRQLNGHQLLTDGPDASRFSGGAAGAGAVTRARGNSMAERGLPFAVPSALAALSGYKRASQPGSAETDATQKGFHRISGRKLPSVLQHGGDGFTDPRDSAASGTSFYRDSTGWWGGSGTDAPRFAVGSPMRPESGVPVIQPGPGRTPVRTPITEQGPVFGSDLTPPLSLDPIGRTLASSDGSRGSASRFTEEI